MTPRERLLKILQGETPDRVPWFGDLDYWTCALIAQGCKYPDFVRTQDYIEWHRDLGVGFYLQGYFPFKTIVENCEVKTWKDGHRRYCRIETPRGVLKECWLYIPDSYTEGPVEHLVKSEADLAALRYVYENTHWDPDYEYARRRLGQIGDQGILLCYLPKSPLMQLVALDAGITTVTFAQINAPDEFAETLAVMEKVFDEAAQIAVDSPAEVLMIPENLSAEMIGPVLFEKYMRAYQQKWVTRIAEAGKYSFIHMDGTLKGLLREEASVGFTVIEAMTPKPVGDLAVEEWASVADHPKTVLWGGIPGSYFTDHVDDEEFDRHVKHVLSVMRKQPRYVLAVADQVPPDGLENRVRRVSQLVDEYGVFK
jgi:uroporphyrinogen-III decarboxylase